VPLITVETELYNLLKSHPTLQSLVGARVYPLVLPQGTALPAITFQRAGTMLRGRIGGPSVLSDRPGLYGVRIQLDCWARNYEGVINLADKVYSVLENYRGPMGRLTVQLTDPVLVIDQYEDDTGLYRRTVDVIVWHERVT